MFEVAKLGLVIVNPGAPVGADGGVFPPRGLVDLVDGVHLTNHALGGSEQGHATLEVGGAVGEDARVVVLETLD